MGKRIVKLFEEADALGGLVARMRLASLAQTTSMEAATVEDRPELVQRVQAALDEVRKQLPPPAREDKPVPAVAQPSSSEDQTRMLRRHLETYLDMMAQRSLFLGDADATIRRVNEAASLTLDVRRVSVWYCDAEQTKLWSVDLYERDKNRHSAGAELSARDFAPYFRALRAERTIAAHDAHTDPRTSCFSKVYLEPLGISSMLDVPIWANRRMVGVVCHEHVGPKRMWTEDEERFAYLMSNFVALALERGGSELPAGPRRVGTGAAA